MQWHTIQFPLFFFFLIRCKGMIRKSYFYVPSWSVKNYALTIKLKNRQLYYLANSINGTGNCFFRRNKCNGDIKSWRKNKETSIKMESFSQSQMTEKGRVSLMGEASPIRSCRMKDGRLKSDTAYFLFSLCLIPKSISQLCEARSTALTMAM